MGIVAVDGAIVVRGIVGERGLVAGDAGKMESIDVAIVVLIVVAGEVY